MKNLIKTIKLFAIILIGCICMAGSCNGTGGGGNPSPTCTESQKQTTSVSTINLSYNFTNAVNFDLIYFRCIIHILQKHKE